MSVPRLVVSCVLLIVCEGRRQEAAKVKMNATGQSQCQRVAGWCGHKNGLSLQDCDGDGIRDPTCDDGYSAGFLSSADGCKDKWPSAVCKACDEWLSGDGKLYRGCQRKTRSGKTCMHWNRLSRGANRNLPDNFCRNPDGHHTIWCYTAANQYEECEPAYPVVACQWAGHAANPNCILPNSGLCVGRVRYGFSGQWSEWTEANGEIICTRNALNKGTKIAGAECQCDIRRRPARGATCARQPGTDIPRNRDRIMGMVGTSGESLLIKSLENIAAIDFTADITEQALTAAPEYGFMYLASLNPPMGIVMALVEDLFGVFGGAGRSDVVTSMLDHMSKMIDRRFEKFVLEQQLKSLDGIAKNIECATTAQTWASIATSFNLAEMFGLPCMPIKYDQAQCTTFRQENGGNKLMVEIMFTSLMATSWLEAQLNAWTDVQSVLQSKLLEAIPLLRLHLDTWESYRTADHVFGPGQVTRHYDDPEGEGVHYYSTCFKAGIDTRLGVHGEKWSAHSCPTASGCSGPPGEPCCYEHHLHGHCCWTNQLAAWEAARIKCRQDHKNAVQAEINNIFKKEIAALENLQAAIREYR